MKSAFDGLPLQIDPDSDLSRLYEGLEYKDFWEDLSKSRLDELEHAIIRDYLPKSGRRIIDVGCGFGRLSDCYLERFDEVVMVDGSMNLLKQAKEISNNRATYVAADANHLPFQSSTFDAVLMIRVFHHMHDSRAILMELHRIIFGKGILLFNYCNKLSARQLVKWFLRRDGQNPTILEPAGIGTEFITHHPKYVCHILNETGFSNVKYLGSGVMDKLVGKAGCFHKLVPSGRMIAPFLGIIKLAPWIFSRAVANKEPDAEAWKSREQIFMCPLCGSDVLESSQSYKCVSCNRSYPINNGIADFRVRI
jgi:SAM-dependent methyltransferase